ncbi:MAG: hypothetical protein HN521_09005 [Candidatus Latescibacteria bacterium]|nr:hypothetical protein [Candidatus Latescibacterota bacterium]
MEIYTDNETGYEIRVLTSDGYYTKPYFDTETTTIDDAKALVTEKDGDKRKLWFVDVGSGEKDLLVELGTGDRFCAPLNDEGGWLFRGETKTINRVDFSDGQLTEIGDVPFCRSATSGHTVFRNGLLAASYQHERMYYVLGVTDPTSGKSEIVYRTDQNTNHAQACPGDDESLLFVHETGGDALQRMWIFNVREGIERPYFIEKLDDWVTHECWTRSGNQVMFCKAKAATGRTDEPDEIWYGDRDGQGFRCVGKGHYHHGAPDVSERWIIADDSRTGSITLLDTTTGENHLIATGMRPRGGAEHCHPSFNRKGNQVLFTAPREGQGVHVAAVDLQQVPAWRNG